MKTDEEAFEKVKVDILDLLEDFPEPIVEDEKGKVRGGPRGKAPARVGFGPKPLGYRTDLMFGEEVRCARCRTLFTRTGPGDYRAACSCWKD